MQAGAAAASTVKKLKPQTPRTAAGCMVADEKVQATPTRFHGKPVRTQPRSHSPISQAKAKRTTQAAGPSASRRATTRPSVSSVAGKSPSSAARPPTAKGIIQANFSASTVKAIPTQYRPITK